MNDLQALTHQYVDLVDTDEARSRGLEPVRIAILDSGFTPLNPLLADAQQANPRIKGWRSFVHGTDPNDMLDEIGHGTHALGILLKVAPSADIYVARIARRETLDPNTYDDIAEARLPLFFPRVDL